MIYITMRLMIIKSNYYSTPCLFAWKCLDSLNTRKIHNTNINSFAFITYYNDSPKPCKTTM